MKPKAGTFRGTASEVAYEGGFAVLEIVDPSVPGGCGEPQGDGFVAAVGFSFLEPVTLLPTGTATVISLTVEGAAPQAGEPIEGKVDWRDGLRGAG